MQQGRHSSSGLGGLGRGSHAHVRPSLTTPARVWLPVLVAALLALGSNGCLVPVPHTRVHAYGVKAQVVSAADGRPVTNAIIASVGWPAATARADRQGRFRLPAKRGWHGAYCIGPICLSLLPGWDVTWPLREISISAPGYETTLLSIGPAHGEPGAQVPAVVAGAYLKAERLELMPARAVSGTGLNPTDGARPAPGQCRHREPRPRQLELE